MERLNLELLESVAGREMTKMVRDDNCILSTASLLILQRWAYCQPRALRMFLQLRGPAKLLRRLHQQSRLEYKVLDSTSREPLHSGPQDDFLELLGVQTELTSFFLLHEVQGGRLKQLHFPTAQEEQLSDEEYWARVGRRQKKLFDQLVCGSGTN